MAATGVLIVDGTECRMFYVHPVDEHDVRRFRVSDEIGIVVGFFFH